MLISVLGDNLCEHELNILESKENIDILTVKVAI